jgi:CRP-like cAMP-binding protein
VFHDLDRAIGWAEDDLLRAAGAGAPEQEELPLAEASIAAGITARELAKMEKHLERRVYEPGQQLFGEGDAGDELFIIVKGSASAFLRHGGGDIRLVTFAQGTVLGELAILDAGPRSASVTTEAGLVCYGLSRTSFAALCEDSPAVAIKLLGNLGRLLSHRLRDANRMIQQLEE